jgi:hypothetical protein
MADTPMTMADLEELGPINQCKRSLQRPDEQGWVHNIDCVLDGGHPEPHETVAGQYFGTGIRTPEPYRPGPPLGWNR